MSQAVPRTKVFVTHASEDLWVARQVCALINACGIDCFLDARDIGTSQNFEDRIDAEARACTEQLVILSHAAIPKSYIWLETGLFAGQGKLTVHLLNGISVNEVLADGRVPARVKLLNLRTLNEIEVYLAELRQRTGGGLS